MALEMNFFEMIEYQRDQIGRNFAFWKNIWINYYTIFVDMTA
jgi:hypothetical protein